jgi:hypothetical protein
VEHGSTQSISGRRAGGRRGDNTALYSTPTLDASQQLIGQRYPKAQSPPALPPTHLAPPCIVSARRRALFLATTATMCRAICIAAPHLDAPAECSSPTSVLPTSRPRRSAVEKVHYEQDAYEPRTYPSIPTLYPPHRRWFRTRRIKILTGCGVAAYRFWQQQCVPPRRHHNSACLVQASAVEAHLPVRSHSPFDMPQRVNDHRANVAYRVAMHPLLTLTIHPRRCAGWRQCTQRPAPSCCSQRARRPPTQCARRSTRTCRRAWT